MVCLLTPCVGGEREGEGEGIKVIVHYYPKFNEHSLGRKSRVTRNNSLVSLVYKSN